jgi:hypothetical protein
MKGSDNPSVGTLASTGDVKIRITAKAENPDEASRLISDMEREIRRRLGTLIYGEDGETLQGNLVKQLEGHELSLVVVEAFTGGYQQTHGHRSRLLFRVCPPSEDLAGFLRMTGPLSTSAKVLRNLLLKPERLEADIACPLLLSGRKPGNWEHRFKIAIISTIEGVRLRNICWGRTPRPQSRSSSLMRR